MNVKMNRPFVREVSEPAVRVSELPRGSTVDTVSSLFKTLMPLRIDMLAEDAVTELPTEGGGSEGTSKRSALVWLADVKDVEIAIRAYNKRDLPEDNAESGVTDYAKLLEPGAEVEGGPQKDSKKLGKAAGGPKRSGWREGIRVTPESQGERGEERNGLIVGRHSFLLKIVQ